MKRLLDLARGWEDATGKEKSLLKQRYLGEMKEQPTADNIHQFGGSKP